MRVEHAGQPAGGLEPERGRYGVLGQRAGRPSGCRGAARPGRRARRPASRSAARERVDGASRAHSISAVSTTSWLVRPRCSQRAASAPSPSAVAQQRDQRQTGLPPASAGRGQRGQVVGADQAGRGRARRDAGAMPDADQRRQPGLLDVDHRLEHARRRRTGRRPARRRARRGRSSRSVSRIGAGRRSRPRPAAGCRSGSRARRGSATSVARRSAATEPSSGSSSAPRRPRQVGAGEEPVEQPAGEDREREERRPRRRRPPGASVVKE